MSSDHHKRRTMTSTWIALLLVSLSIVATSSRRVVQDSRLDNDNYRRYQEIIATRRGQGRSGLTGRSGGVGPVLPLKEEVVYQQEIHEMLWLELQAWFSGRTLGEQDIWLIRWGTATE